MSQPEGTWIDGMRAGLDRARATVQFELGSMVCCRFPGSIGRWLVGPHPVRWRVMRTPASDIEWIVAAGDPQASWRPAGFRQGLFLPAEPLPALPAGHRRAVAFAAGRTVVAAQIPDGGSAVIVGIGGGDLRARIGTVDPLARTFTPDLAETSATVPVVATLSSLMNEHPGVPRV